MPAMDDRGEESGNMPAQATANNVIASEKRLIDVRQSCLSSSKIAEIKVPACPIPIHQTKFTIANPQATGIMIPQIPTPRRNSQVTATISRLTSRNASPKPTNICRRRLQEWPVNNTRDFRL